MINWVRQYITFAARAGSTSWATQGKAWESPLSPHRVIQCGGRAGKRGELMWIGSCHNTPLTDHVATILCLSDHVSFCCDLNFAMKSFGLESSEGGCFKTEARNRRKQRNCVPRSEILTNLVILQRFYKPAVAFRGEFQQVMEEGWKSFF